MNWADITKIAAGAMAGAVVSWAATSLTLVGRVDAMEKAVGRLEALMTRYMEPKGSK